MNARTRLYKCQKCGKKTDSPVIVKAAKSSTGRTGQMDVEYSRGEKMTVGQDCARKGIRSGEFKRYSDKDRVRDSLAMINQQTGKADGAPATDTPDANSKTATSTRTEVRSPTSTRTEVRSPTSTSTDAFTQGNFTATVTGGAGAGDTTVHIKLPSPLEANNHEQTSRSQAARASHRRNRKHLDQSVNAPARHGRSG